jgi:hypothetical protein
MKLRQEELRGHRADESEEHVPLGIPGIPLGSEEGIGGLPHDERSPPLDELVEGAEGETDADDEEEQPLPGPERRLPEENLPGKDRRNKPLGEVPEAVVVVSSEVEQVLNPEAERDLGVGVVTAQHQDEGMDKEKTVEERSEREAAIGGDESPRGPR